MTDTFTFHVQMHRLLQIVFLSVGWVCFHDAVRYWALTRKYSNIQSTTILLSVQVICSLLLCRYISTK